MAIGYGLRQAECSAHDDFNTFDLDDATKLVDVSHEYGPKMAVAMGAMGVSEGLPEPFSFSDDTWAELEGWGAEVGRFPAEG